jgi:starvation-inducible DNA-binding protein
MSWKGEKMASSETGRLSEMLNEALIDAARIAVDAKQLHWNLVGPQFKALHEQLDELADAARGWSDEIAERIVAVGKVADGTVTAIARSKLPAVKVSEYSQHDTVAHVTALLEGASSAIREGFEEIGALDLVSQDLLIGIVREMEKQAWMFRVQLF